MKIQDEKRAGSTTIMPFIGKVTFDEKGIIEVDDEHVKDLLSAVEGLHEVGKKVTKSKDEDKTPPVKSEAQIMKEKAIENINKAKLKDLQEMAKEAELNEDNWGELKVKELKAYLINQLPIVV